MADSAKKRFKVSLEAYHDKPILEVRHNGEEIHVQPKTIAQSKYQILSRLDFDQVDTLDSGSSEAITNKPLVTDRDQMASELRSALQQIEALADVLGLVSKKMYLGSEKAVPRYLPTPLAHHVSSKKKECRSIGEMLMTESKSLQNSLTVEKAMCEKLQSMSRSWQFRPLENSPVVIVDVSLRGCGSKHPVLLEGELRKNEDFKEDSSESHSPLLLFLNPNYRCLSEIHVDSTQNPPSAPFSSLARPKFLPLTSQDRMNPLLYDINNQLHAAQQCLFHEEIISRLIHDALETGDPNTVVLNDHTVLFRFPFVHQLFMVSQTRRLLVDPAIPPMEQQDFSNNVLVSSAASDSNFIGLLHILLPIAARRQHFAFLKGIETNEGNICGLISHIANSYFTHLVLFKALHGILDRLNRHAAPVVVLHGSVSADSPFVATLLFTLDQSRWQLPISLADVKCLQGGVKIGPAILDAFSPIFPSELLRVISQQAFIWMTNVVAKALSPFGFVLVPQLACNFGDSSTARVFVCTQDQSREVLLESGGGDLGLLGPRLALLVCGEKVASVALVGLADQSLFGLCCELFR